MNSIVVGPIDNVLQIVLYKDKDLTVEASKRILELTIMYIFETKRFN